MKLDEQDFEQMRGVYHGQPDVGPLNLSSEVEANLRLLHATDGVFPEHDEEEARLNMRIEEEGVFLDVDEFASTDEAPGYVEQFYERSEAIEKIRRRRALEAAADELLRPVSDGAPVDYRLEPSDRRKPRHDVMRYKMSRMVREGRFNLRAVAIQVA